LNAAAPGGVCNQFGPNNVAAVQRPLPVAHTCVTVRSCSPRQRPHAPVHVVFSLTNLALCGPIEEGSTSVPQQLHHLPGERSQPQILTPSTAPSRPGLRAATSPGSCSSSTTNTIPSSTGTVTINGVVIFDCGNPRAILPGIPGAPSTIPSTPRRHQRQSERRRDKTTNTTDDGTTWINVTVPAVAAGDIVRVRKKGFGNYPEYDDAPGAGSTPGVPATEAAAIAAGWAVAFTTAPGGGVIVPHEPAARDFWHLVAFVEDPCGNVSGATAITSGNLNYHLGDVEPTGTPGNSRVQAADVSRLGFHYGAVLGPSDARGDLDVGPTTDFSTNTRPTTDNRVNFEDLVLFAINFLTVSFNEPPAGLADVPGGRPVLTLRTEPTPDGVLARLFLDDNPGNVKGIHALVDFDRAGLALVAVEQGGLLDAQGQPIFFRHLDEGGRRPCRRPQPGVGLQARRDRPPPPRHHDRARARRPPRPRQPLPRRPAGAGGGRAGGGRPAAQPPRSPGGPSESLQPLDHDPLPPAGGQPGEPARL
jgi:hypothetical protein